MASVSGDGREAHAACVRLGKVWEGGSGATPSGRPRGLRYHHGYARHPVTPPPAVSPSLPGGLGEPLALLSTQPGSQTWVPLGSRADSGPAGLNGVQDSASATVTLRGPC